MDRKLFVNVLCSDEGVGDDSGAKILGGGGSGDGWFGCSLGLILEESSD